jgi:MSHA biogenesis protein MshN
MLSFKNGPLEFYEISRRGNDFVLAVMPKSHIKMAAFIGDKYDNNVAPWVLRFEPVNKASIQRLNMAEGPVIKNNQPVVAKKNKKVQFKKRIDSALNIEAEYERALSLLNNGMSLSATNKLQSIINVNPSMHKARELLANLYLRSGREVEAFLLLDQGIKLDENYAPFVRLYTQALIQRDRLNDAKRVLISVRNASNLDAEYYALFAGVSQRLSEHESAVTNYMHALEMESGQGIWWLGLGISLEALNKSAAAVGAYMEAAQTGKLNSGLLQYANARLLALRK